jgi:hypothetical protein
MNEHRFSVSVDWKALTNGTVKTTVVTVILVFTQLVLNDSSGHPNTFQWLRDCELLIVFHFSTPSPK